MSNVVDGMVAFQRKLHEIREHGGDEGVAAFLDDLTERAERKNDQKALTFMKAIDPETWP